MLDIPDAARLIRNTQEGAERLLNFVYQALYATDLAARIASDGSETALCGGPDISEELALHVSIQILKGNRLDAVLNEIASRNGGKLVVDSAPR